MRLRVTDLEIEQDVLNNNWSEKIPCINDNIYHYLSCGHFAKFISETKSLVLEVFYNDDDSDCDYDEYYLLINECSCKLSDFTHFQISKKWFDFMQNLYPDYKPKETK